MNNRGLISSRSDVIALLSGELLELRTETSYLFTVTSHWEPHYYLLTSIGIFKFIGTKMEKTPVFVPLRNILTAKLVEDEVSKFTAEKILKIDFTDPEK